MMPTEVRNEVKRQWLYQKVMSLDFHGLRREKIKGQFERAFPEVNSSLAITDGILYMGKTLVEGMENYKQERVHALIRSDSEGEDYGPYWTLRELLHELGKRFAASPYQTFDVVIITMEYARNKNGHMDVAGEQREHHIVHIIKGIIVKEARL